MKLEPRERRFLVWLSTAVILVTSAPYLFGWLVTPSNRTYTGIHRLTPGDVSVYYSFIEQGRQGSPVSRNLFSSEPQVPSVLTPQWFVVGQLAHLFHLPTVLAYQLTRLIFVALFLILAYRFLAGLLAQIRVRMIAMVAVAFATGFGAFIPIRDMGYAVQHLALPIDTWVPESFPFLSLYHNPLFLMGLCGVLGALLLVERRLDTGDRSAAWFASGLALVLAIIHPYDVFLLAAILGSLFILRLAVKFPGARARLGDDVKVLGLVLGPAVLALGIIRVIFQVQPALAGWAAQNVTLSPALWWYVPAYLVPVTLAFVGVRATLRLQSTRALMVLAWAGVVPLLLYVPFFPYQRRMMEGWFIALVALGGVGLASTWARLRPRLSPVAQSGLVSAAATLAILCFGMTSLSHLAKDSYYASFGSEPVSIPRGLTEAFTWIRNHTDDDAIVLARPYDANLLPGWTARRTYYGHDDLTADSARKAQEVEALFAATSRETAGDFLARERISYVLVRQRDAVAQHAVAQGILPLAPVYVNADASVYRVVEYVSAGA